MGALSIFARLEDLSSKFMRLQARAARLDETLLVSNIAALFARCCLLAPNKLPTRTVIALANPIVPVENTHQTENRMEYIAS